MLEVLPCLRSNGFKTYIISGGGMGFMRLWINLRGGDGPWWTQKIEWKVIYPFEFK